MAPGNGSCEYQFAQIGIMPGHFDPIKPKEMCRGGSEREFVPCKGQMCNCQDEGCRKSPFINRNPPGIIVDIEHVRPSVSLLQYIFLNKNDIGIVCFLCEL